ncbi:major facilitator superfamily domain-containing protein [Penicillium capsulatum]|uniref:Major facilitator superfamily domain-containing protein n=1 Tax=Penicillium capsulatum TaxID=69766 RepID=A0A9W9IRR5_9EURO|nr:major facilitator superfamily domain-containing protein [Penicillium capsulatum]KAJ6130248.1 major facilitator superfamily domain-containing protein [Penicillium capsulatum]
MMAETYLIFVALQYFAVPLAIFLTRPENVQRSDGSKVKIVRQPPWRAGILELWKVYRRKEIVLLLPVFWASFFNQYEGNFETYYFGVRARASLGLVAWVYGWVIQEKYTTKSPSLDGPDKGYTRGLFVMLLWEFSRQALQNWLYYLLSTMTDNISELFSYGMNTREWHERVLLAVNTTLLGPAVLPTWLVIKSHVPIEHGSEAVTLTANRDEEEIVQNGIGADVKNQAAVAQEVPTK